MISPEASGLVGATAAEGRNLHYVRCPVSGNPGVLASGNATLIVSGSTPSVAQLGLSSNMWGQSCSTSENAKRPE